MGNSFKLSFFALISLFAYASSQNLYGQHFPQGNAAVQYIYGEEGTFKNTFPLNYIWNYYEQYSSPAHPFDKERLIAEANGSRTFTARDANGYLLCDFDLDHELDDIDCGFSFHEHNGKGTGGETRGNPFTQFWLDDNWLARYMSQAYNRPAPGGLQDQSGFMRWKIIGRDPTNYVLYNTDHFDTLALDGLYYLAIGDVNSSIAKWDRIWTLSELYFDTDTNQYMYPAFTENYHVGLWKIFTDLLMDTGDVTGPRWRDLIQHSVSIRSMIIREQEHDTDYNWLGWTSHIEEGNSLINTESVSVNVLGLSTNVKYAFEAIEEPMKNDPSGNYFCRWYNVLSAVVGLSFEGTMSYGPGVMLSQGFHNIEYFLRSPHRQQGRIAYIYVFDQTRPQIVAEMDVYPPNLNDGNNWTILNLEFFALEGHEYEFRTYWFGTHNLDLALVKVK